MQTWIYRNKEGEDYMVVHRNSSLLIWNHGIEERVTCEVCLGKSEAAPKLSTPAPAVVQDREDSEGGNE